MKNLLTLLLLIFAQYLSAQTEYFSVKKGIIFPAVEYENLLQSLNDQGKVEITHFKDERKKDSLIHHVRLTFLPKNSPRDPYASAKKWLGKDFPVASFAAANAGYVSGKPSIVNFWFTTCGPCIKEIPHLNQLQEKLQDKINFLAITFNDEPTVERFKTRFPFSWPQIYDAKPGIGEMRIQSYPTNMLLDKEGKVIFVFGSLDANFVQELIDIFELLE